MRRIAAAFLLALTLLAPAAAYAQVCPPVAALPDTERRTAYAPSASTGPFSVNFSILGDSTDYGNWVEVWLNGVMLTPVTDWQLTIPSGTLASACRPITNASITLTAAATGTLQIVGARRPRRTSQFAENVGVSARSINQVITDLTAQNRETWDKINDVSGRGLFSQPGVTLGRLPLPAACAGGFLAFDGTGLQPVCLTGAAGSGNVVGPNPTTNNGLALWNGTTGTLLKDGPGRTVQGAYSWAGINTFNVSPLVPTATAGDNTTKAASTAFVQAAVLAPTATIDVFAIGGQSNAQGQSGDQTLSPPVPTSYVLQYSGGTISAGNDPVGNANTSSAWPSFGIAYVAATGRKVLLVPSALGGTDQCTTTGASTLNWDIGGTLAPLLVANVTAAMAAARTAGYSPVYRGILWSQGENDAGAIGNNPVFPTLGVTTVTGGPYSAGTTVITVASATGMSINEFAVITLDNGTTYSTNITVVSGTTLTLQTAVPAGRSIPNGAQLHIYAQADYRTCLQNMLNYFRTTTTDSTTFPQLPFYISQTGASQGGDSLGYQKVRQAQDQVAQADPYTKIAFRGAVDFIARGMMQPGGSLHYLQEGYNEMGREMAKAVVSSQASDPWIRQTPPVGRVVIGGTLRTGDVLEIIVTSTAIPGSPWTIQTSVLAGETFCSFAAKAQKNASYFSPNLNAVGISSTYTCSGTGAVFTFYKPVTLSPQAIVTASWVTSGATETATFGEGTSAYGNSADLYYNKGRLIVGGLAPATTASIFDFGKITLISNVAAGTENYMLTLSNQNGNVTDQRVGILLAPSNLALPPGAGTFGRTIYAAADTITGRHNLHIGGYSNGTYNDHVVIDRSGAVQFSQYGAGTLQTDASGNVTAGAGGGGGTVTSVALAMPGIFTVSGSPVTTTGTLTATASGTSGGIPYFSSGTALASSAALTANLPVIGGGAGAAPTVGTRSGNTTAFATVTGTLTSGRCVQIDANGNFVQASAACSAVSAAALTKTDDTNVTLTLGGSPSTALLAATSITVGWTGNLANSRLTAMANLTAKGNISGASATPTDIPIQEVLTGPRTYFYRTDGNDACTGLVNAAGSSGACAKLTMQAAYAAAAAINFAGFTVTIQAGNAGTRTAGLLVNLGWTGGGILVVDCNGTTISTTSADAIGTDGQLGGLMKIQGCTVQTTTTGNGITHQAVGKLQLLTGMVFGATANQQIKAQGAGVTLQILNDYSVTGGAKQHVSVQHTAFVFSINLTVTLTAAIAYTQQFAQVLDRAGYESVGTTWTNGTTVTGQRYNAASNSVINTAGAGVNYFPGNAAGATATGAQYL